jgi:ATP-binding cassette subfamily C protein LapB
MVWSLNCWLRFDQRRLPALMCFEGNWWLAERGENDNLRLTDAGGSTREVDEILLSEAVVLWLGRPCVTTDLRDSGREENPAARMVWRELFKSRGWVLEVFIATVIINPPSNHRSLHYRFTTVWYRPCLCHPLTLVAGCSVIGIDWLLKNLRHES